MTACASRNTELCAGSCATAAKSRGMCAASARRASRPSTITRWTCGWGASAGADSAETSRYARATTIRIRRRVDPLRAKSYKPDVPTSACLTVLPGDGPLVVVAPHGGRRDAERRPWAGGHLRMNDLHTASLTAELAALLGGPALINEAHDRNDVDLNRVSEAHQRAPWFLERLADLVDAAVRRHGRATLLALHGWNVVQPVVDLGLGCTPGEDPFAVGRAAAVSPAFAARALPRLVEACRARGIAATVGARYPARHRENLVQLFTPRYAEDGRPLVRALAALAPLVDAVQLELGIALRWPGPWRGRPVARRKDALPRLPAPSGPPRSTPADTTAAASRQPA